MSYIATLLNQRMDKAKKYLISMKSNKVKDELTSCESGMRCSDESFIMYATGII